LKIAVVEDNNQKTSSIFEPGLITIYTEEGGEWQVLNRFENKVFNAKGIPAVRMAVEDTIKQLGDVRIIAASEFPGVAFGFFQAAFFDIFLAEDSVPDILNSIKKDVVNVIGKKQEETTKFDIIKFLEPGMNKGDFSLNLEEVLLKNPDLSSKKVLIPYLKKGEFKNLNVVFSHIPKWFDTELEVLGFRYEIVNELPNKMTLRIVNV
jgi:Fe-only nitrogenase accessory protein AnfO